MGGRLFRERPGVAAVAVEFFVRRVDVEERVALGIQLFQFRARALRQNRVARVAVAGLDGAPAVGRLVLAIVAADLHTILRQNPVAAWPDKQLWRRHWNLALHVLLSFSNQHFEHLPLTIVFLFRQTGRFENRIPNFPTLSLDTHF